MNKKRVIMLSSVTMAAMVAGGTFMSIAATADPGTSGDPVITESYMKAQVNSLQKQIDELKTKVNSLSSSGSSSNSGSSNNGSSNSSLGTGTTTANALNVRTGPGTSYSVVKSLSKGTTVTLLEKSGSWYKIKAGSTTGWVAAEYLKIK